MSLKQCRAWGRTADLLASRSADGESEAEIARRLARARENEYLPFAAAGEDDDDEGSLDAGSDVRSDEGRLA